MIYLFKRENFEREDEFTRISKIIEEVTSKGRTIIAFTYKGKIYIVEWPKALGTSTRLVSEILTHEILHQLVDEEGGDFDKVESFSVFNIIKPVRR